LYTVFAMYRTLLSKEVMRVLDSSLSLPHTIGFTFKSACRKKEKRTKNFIDK
jgi:hypothetical protein